MQVKRGVLLVVLVLAILLQLQAAYSSFISGGNIDIDYDLEYPLGSSTPNFDYSSDTVDFNNNFNGDVVVVNIKDTALVAAAFQSAAATVAEYKQGNNLYVYSEGTNQYFTISETEEGTQIFVRDKESTEVFGTGKFTATKKETNEFGQAKTTGTLTLGGKTYDVEVTSSPSFSSTPTNIKVTETFQQPFTPIETIFIPEPPTYIPLYVPPTIPFCTPKTEVCDGIDNNCNSIIDDYVINDCASEAGLCPKQVGVCKGTRKKCSGLNNYQDCTINEYGVSGKYESTETSCDNLDNDCDGSIDEGCGCLPASTKPCGYNDKGVCQLGTQVCSADGKWGECAGAVYPDSFKETACDGLDNDCDGLVDECVTNPCGECGQLPTEVCNYQDENCNAEPQSPTSATFNGKFYQDFGNYCPAGTVCKGSYADGVDNNNDGIIDEGIDEDVKSKPNNNYQSWCETCAANYGQACGNCGTYDCQGNCVNQGVCSPNSVQCSGDTTQTCGGNCQWQSVQNCNAQDGLYCNGAVKEYRNYGCSAGSCSYTVTSSENCNSLDGWYGGGNTQTAACGSTDNDASSEYRDYGCGAGSCTYSVTQTKDCDTQDGWYGGSNTQGCGTDPNSVWNDYYVTANTNSCASTTACTGTGSINCDSSDICNNKCEGTIFTSVPPMKDYYVVSNSNSCTSTTDSPVTEDCATKASTDTDGSSTAYTTAGMVTDYTSCTLTGCGSSAYSDACSGTTLTEYGASGNSITSSNYDCQNYETFYCSNDKYFRQEWGCSGAPGYCNDAAAADTPAGTNADGDAKDLQCGDSLCDNAAGVYDSTKTATETNCNDGLDNDCDGMTDCADPDCAGSITGNVKNQDSQPVSLADVSAKKDLATIKSATTNSQGNYNIASINCGAYNLVASHSGYQPQTKTINLQPNQQLTADFSLVLGTACEQDCTFASDDIIHAYCDGKNGCTFYDSISKAACDNSQPGWVRDYNSTHYVACASGAPQPKIEIESSISCASGTLVKITRIVVYNGKPVKLTVATCG